MLRKAVGYEPGKAKKIDVLSLGQINEPSQLTCEMGRLRWRSCPSPHKGTEVALEVSAGVLHLLRPSQHQVRENEQPFELRHRTRYFRAGTRHPCSRRQFRQQRQLLIPLLDRTNPREEQGRSRGCLKKRFVKRPHSAPRWEQDGDPGKIERLRRTAARKRQLAGEDRPGEGGEERLS